MANFPKKKRFIIKKTTLFYVGSISHEYSFAQGEIYGRLKFLFIYTF